MDAAYIQAVVAHQLFHQVAAHLAEVPGHNQVKVLRGGAGVVQVVDQGLGGGGSHGGAHIIGILDAQVGDAPEEDLPDADIFGAAEGRGLAPNNQRAGGRRRPL